MEAFDMKNNLNILREKGGFLAPKRNSGEKTQTLAQEAAILLFGKVFPSSFKI